jgi:hypothetical protein
MGETEIGIRPNNQKKKSKEICCFVAQERFFCFVLNGFVLVG